jgi:DNA-binding CsgD family transcriptional regulator
MTAKKRGRGRPPFKPTKAQRERVKTCKAAGMTNDELALGLGIDRNTLEKHFAYELGQGATNRRQEAMDKLWQLGKGGNVSALKAYISKLEEDKYQIPPAPLARKTDKQAAAEASGTDEKIEKLGKKEQAQVDAVNAGQNTEWADLLPTSRPQ